MPFEPLQTDEKLEKPVAKAWDMDTQMLFGCTGFVLAAIGTYLMAVWPFVAFRDAERVGTLAMSAAFGMLPASVFGGVLVRKFALPGACGFFAGSLAVAIFLFLRIEQVFLSAAANQAPVPDYPEAFRYLVPVGYLVFVLILCLVLLPKDVDGPPSGP
jgi:hypothetical protein